MQQTIFSLLQAASLALKEHGFELGPITAISSRLLLRYPFLPYINSCWNALKSPRSMQKQLKFLKSPFSIFRACSCSSERMFRSPPAPRRRFDGSRRSRNPKPKFLRVSSTSGPGKKVSRSSGPTDSGFTGNCAATFCGWWPRSRRKISERFWPTSNFLSGESRNFYLKFRREFRAQQVFASMIVLHTKTRSILQLNY